MFLLRLTRKRHAVAQPDSAGELRRSALIHSRRGHVSDLLIPVVIFMATQNNPECRNGVLEITPSGAILEIAFAGVHEGDAGQQIGNYVTGIVEDLEPAAVILNFIKFKYTFGNDIAGICSAFVRKNPPSARPCCIVAKGKTAKSLWSLLDSAQLTTTFDITFYENVAEAVYHLRSRLEQKRD